MTAELLASETWHEANQRYLVAAIDRVRRALERHAGSGEVPALDDTERLPVVEPCAALERLSGLFGLSPFERDLLLLCAGVELDSRVAALCGSAPTFSMALAALPRAHWSALTPAAPLRYWRLIEVGVGAALANSPLRIDERILHYLAGVDYVDERLAGIIDAVTGPEPELCTSQQQVADRIEGLWRCGANAAEPPGILLLGADAAAQRDIVRAACGSLRLSLDRIAAQTLPTAGHELDVLLRIWQREFALASCALLLDCSELDESDGQRVAAVRRLVESLRGPLIVAARQPPAYLPKPLVTLEVERLTRAEQEELWRRQLGVASTVEIDMVVSQFSLSAPAIAALAQQASGTAWHNSATTLWDLCRSQTRPRLESLARRIEPRATWDDLVLPPAPLRLLREAALQVRQRSTVYERWGFATRSSRGLGISLLASGPSGTGKTMAAEVLANYLRLDLYHIDLSQVVSKYIGETERNLARLFDAAEGGGAILLFDEADALFGKRSEIKDSHDRYANIEISYLLQRMEAYRGLAILTTNMKDALDPAFLRRIRFVVQFPFPDEVHRRRIWRGVFPVATPTEGLDFDRLARLNLSGGNIRNVAMNAAFLAAEDGSPVTMRHLAAAARSELMKIDKPINEAELATWL
jgi:ATP-dependent 26S proteasome regulatory subunit